MAEKKTIRTLILRAAGTNCDTETACAFRKAGSKTELVHVNALVKRKSYLSKFHILAIPGGFTYGDDIASGKILANELKHALRHEISEFVNSGKLIIGICNGFQVLVKMGLLPNTNSESTPGRTEATLGINDSGRFEDRWVYLRSASGNKCIWTQGIPEVIYLPVAHGEGKFIPKDKALLARIQKRGQVVFRYSDEKGNSCSGYPFNPNGSLDDIAGICDPTGRMFGLMPHPERHMFSTQHPFWHRNPSNKSTGIGLHIFRNGVNFMKQGVCRTGRTL